jgi:hypothetical protein
MNFFGHAAVASWRSAEPAFVLGTMLPDLAAMIRTRPPRAKSQLLEQGIAFHHLTDHAFHDTPTFRELGAEAFDKLLEAGVTRGPARAAAHVGVEILLDGSLARERKARSAYLAALAYELEGSELEWTALGDAGRFAELVAALSARGISPEHAAPDMVALRIERALSSRPRLALRAGDRELVGAWARVAGPIVLARTEPLIAELRQALADLERGC